MMTGQAIPFLPHLPYSLLKLALLVAWFCLCLYSIRRTYRSPLISDRFTDAACLAALFTGPLLLIILFIVDTVCQIADGRMPMRRVVPYMFHTIFRVEHPESPCVQLMTEDGQSLDQMLGHAAPANREPQEHQTPLHTDDTPIQQRPVVVDLTGDAGLPEKEQPALPEKASQPILVHPAESVVEVQFRTIVEAFCAEAMKRKAQWIIIEPDIAGGYQIGLEIGGRYHRWQQLMPGEAVGVMSLIRTMAGIPQDLEEDRRGTFTGRSGDVTAYFRVVEVSALAGQRMTIRVFNSALTPPKLDQLGYTAAQLAQIQKALCKDSGLILFCGPARSGKKTALYSALDSVRSLSRHITSVEGQIEFAMLGINQTQASDQRSVAKMLHTLEQTDAEVIMIDCLADADTAELAVRLAQNGRLVLAGLDASAAEAALVKLTDWGISAPELAQTVVLVCAQRLISQLCPICKVKAQLSDFQQDYLGNKKVGTGSIYAPGGCPDCFQTGYMERAILADVVEMNETLARQLRDPQFNAARMAAEGNDRMFHHLRREGMQWVLAGKTSMQEIKRIIQGLEGKP
ncbi:MAG: ATPase, T2SS/T4P/T4SS family [Anaerohalosphaeraceae bacterium]